MDAAPPHSLASPASLAFLCRALVVEPGVAPGAAVSCGARDGAAWIFSEAAAGVRSSSDPTSVSASTLYDLASVTKPFVAVTAARLARSGQIAWNAPLTAFVPEASGTASSGISLECLASHRAGLDAHLPLFEPLTRGRPVDRGGMLRAAAAARRPECRDPVPPEGFPPVYSDLGYLLLGEALSRATGTALDALVDEHVAAPLGIEVGSAAQWAARDPARLAAAAPTETVDFRGGVVSGQTHDENAWAFAGLGTAGHAGLFATALAVARFGAAVVDALDGRLAEWLGPSEARRLVRARPGGSLRAGFDGKSDEGSSAGPSFGRRAFGHLGFTGTSLWCDPDTYIVASLLTNRVCPSREHLAIREARPLVHDGLYRAALASRSAP